MSRNGKNEQKQQSSPSWNRKQQSNTIKENKTTENQIKKQTFELECLDMNRMNISERYYKY